MNYAIITLAGILDKFNKNMNDISNKNQNQAVFKVPKENVHNFRNQQQSKQQTTSANDNINPLAQSSRPNKTDINIEQPIIKQTPTMSNQKPKVNVIKNQETIDKTQQANLQTDINSVREQIKSTQIKKTDQKPSSNMQRFTSKIPQNNLKPEAPLEIGQLDKQSLIITIIKYALIAIVALVFGYIIVNWPALALKYNYWNTIRQDQVWSELHPIEIHQAQTTAQKLDENYLYIDSLGIQAPVNWGVAAPDIKSMLGNGLVNYTAGSLPDDATGNIYIAGQTSAPIWSSSNYKTVFTLLNKISQQDKIMLIYKNKIYTYQVDSITKNFGDTIINPANESESILHLLAKYPVGIGWSTFDVKAKLIVISNNVAESIDDKEKINKTELEPKVIKPTATPTYTPSNSLIDDSTAPQVFLPEL